MKWKIRLIIAVILFLACLVYCTASFKKSCNSYANTEIKKQIIAGLTDLIGKNIKEHSEEISNSIKISSSGDDIHSIILDTVALNLFAANITANAIVSLENRADLGIPLGNLTPFHLLSGKGPELKVKIVPLGNISGTIESKFISKGINQTVYRVFLRLEALLNVLAPFDTATVSVSLEYVLSEIVIVGKVPNVYYNFEATP